MTKEDDVKFVLRDGEYVLTPDQIKKLGGLKAIAALAEWGTVTKAQFEAAAEASGKIEVYPGVNGNPKNSLGEVRSVSSSGGEKGVKPEAYALLPSEALDEIARVYAFGAEKYAAHNWRKGYEWSKSFSALMRHLWSWWRGEDLDPESGLSHLAHAGFHVLGMLTFVMKGERYAQFDDRYKEDNA